MKKEKIRVNLGKLVSFVYSGYDSKFIEHLIKNMYKNVNKYENENMIFNKNEMVNSSPTS